MKRVTYLLKDMSGEVRARLVSPEEEGVVLEPWMVHNINQRGWSLESWEVADSGIEVHGWADWRGVADNMAAVLKPLLDDSLEWSDEEANELLARAEQSLDDYQMACMEAAMAQPAAEPQREPDESEEADDGGEPTGA